MEKVLLEDITDVVPCLSDIVKYARVVKTKISVKGKTFTRNLIAIGDPCMNVTKFIDQKIKNH